MKKFNKGMVITSTVAAALAALTFAGCGSTEIAPKAAPTNSASAVQAVKNEEAEMPAAAVSAEAAGEKTAASLTLIHHSIRLQVDKITLPLRPGISLKQRYASSCFFFVNENTLRISRFA